MMLEEFIDFYRMYVTQTSTSRNDEQLYRLNHYTLQKLLFMATQVDSRNFTINFDEFPSTYLRRTSDYILYEYPGDIYIIVTINGNIFIEKPTSSRKAVLMHPEFDKYSICTTSYTRSIDHADYILSNCGNIVFRDIHDEFYNLLYDGQTHAAFDKALDILEKVNYGRN